MSNVSIFREFLQQENVILDELQNNDGSIYFRGKETFNNGGSVSLIISFSENEEIIDIYIFDIAVINNPLKKEPILSLINEINVENRFGKFYEVDGRIQAQHSFYVKQNELHSGVLIDILLNLIRSTENNYSKFMKLQWS